MVLWVVCPKEINTNSLVPLLPRNGVPIRRSKMWSSSSFSASKLSFSSGLLAYSGTVANPQRSSEEKVYEVVLKQAALVREQRITRKEKKALGLIETDKTTNWDLLNEAYERCGEVCAEYAKTFYLGTYSFLLFVTCSSSFLYFFSYLVFLFYFFMHNTRIIIFFFLFCFAL